VYELQARQSAVIFEEVFDCLSKIEENLSNLQIQNSNGGLPDNIDMAEVNRWTEETRRKRLEKSKVAYQE